MQKDQVLEVQLLEEVQKEQVLEEAKKEQVLEEVQRVQIEEILKRELLRKEVKKQMVIMLPCHLCHLHPCPEFWKPDIQHPNLSLRVGKFPQQET